MARRDRVSSSGCAQCLVWCELRRLATPRFSPLHRDVPEDELVHMYEEGVDGPIIDALVSSPADLAEVLVRRVAAPGSARGAGAGGKGRRCYLTATPAFYTRAPRVQLTVSPHCRGMRLWLCRHCSWGSAIAPLSRRSPPRGNSGRTRRGPAARLPSLRRWTCVVQAAARGRPSPRPATRGRARARSATGGWLAHPPARHGTMLSSCYPPRRRRRTLRLGEEKRAFSLSPSRKASPP